MLRSIAVSDFLPGSLEKVFVRRKTCSTYGLDGRMACAVGLDVGLL